MIGKTGNVGQKHMFLPNLVELVNPEHELSLLAGELDSEGIESGFASLYSDVGCPAKPIRLMVGLLILKQMYDLADETVMLEWVSNPYFQYFCGETVVQWKYPCDPSDLVHCRHRIGESGVERKLAAGMRVHCEKGRRGDA